MLNSQHGSALSYHSTTAPPSPVESRTYSRRLASSRTSDLDLRGRLASRLLGGASTLNETSGLLANSDGFTGGYGSKPHSTPGTPRAGLLRQRSQLSSVRSLHHSRHGSLGLRLARALGTDRNQLEASNADPVKDGKWMDDRVWYDQFTSTDWVHDSIADAFRIKELRSRRDWRGRLHAVFDGAQGWILVAMIGCLTAAFAYFIDVTEATIYDYKSGYCRPHWYMNERSCCAGATQCKDWVRWSSVLHQDGSNRLWLDYAAYIAWTILLAVLSCLVTMQTKTTISSAVSLSTLDENLGAETSRRAHEHEEGKDANVSPTRLLQRAAGRPPMIYYPAAGSGVAEVKVILSGFVLHGYLGVKTLLAKTLGIILAVASGMSLGKEGPFVHIATCIGNVLCRFFEKYRNNDGKRREILSAAAASGVAVAFGAPIGGVLFSLEEVSYYFPPKTLFRTFFCCIAAALSLRFLNPYGTGKIVLFQVRYTIDWKFFEIIGFILVGILGGATGAFFIKASRVWATTFRRGRLIKQYPLVEVALIAVITGIVGFWNRYTRLPVAELLFELASPCNSFSESGTGLCPTEERIPTIIGYLCAAFIIKAILTTITFGIKVPAGIYVPSMVLGGLMGRITGHVVQLLTIKFPNFPLWDECAASGNPEGCVVPGVYALVAAGATMCGVTRLSVTLAVILFELSGSLEHVLPFSLGVLVAKWTADALEPFSIYDLLTDMNSYPYLDAKVRPVFTSDLSDITPAPHPFRCVDISASPLVPAKALRQKLQYLHMAGELDGGLPVIRDGILAGLIPAPDLEFALDRLEGDEEHVLCLMSTLAHWQGPGRGVARGGTSDDQGAADDHYDDNTSNDADEEANLLNSRGQRSDPSDFTPYIDPAPVSLDISSPMDLVFECFVKLGLRYICVLQEGKFVGLVHKKAFVKCVKENEKAERHVR
ncbi:hypothetical protein K431DRAFT_223589 [Polychaeton citri CBS 116435]|uniref:Chloride channel protein n=1 Tax=Polychaeton citri CBS 116435 TaxID=1314669 RepID=A0A9P4UPC6_9PEZI|nr:hypothetical protein K431DRAFT_223589 [Polychaeton citri CBS 116435]